MTKLFFIIISRPYRTKYSAQLHIQTSYEVNKYEKGSKRVKVFRAMSIQFTATLDFRNSRLQKQSRKHESHISDKISIEPK